MIELRRKNGIISPLIICDVCGKRIKDASMGMVSFSSLEEGKLSFRIVHKNTCDTNEPMWQELKHFLVWLLHNTGMDSKEYKKANVSASYMEMMK